MLLRNVHSRSVAERTTRRRPPQPAPGPARLVALVVILFAVMAVARDAAAESLRIKVRGAAKITARASRDQGELVLSGSLTDDAGMPLTAESVTVRVTREAQPDDAAVAEALRGARGCDRSAARPRHPTAWSVSVQGAREAPEVLLLTDEDGRFCFRAKLDPDRFTASLHWRGARADALLDPADHEIAFDLSRRSLALDFDPRPKIVPLEPAELTFEAVAILDDDATPRVAENLVLVLTSETGKELARAATDPNGRVRFVVEPSKLGPPGPGELRISFAGDAETAKALHVEHIERRAKVVVRVPAAERGELTAQVPEDGIALQAEITSAQGPVAEGAIEARVGEVVVGAAPVERGIARLTLTFAAQGNEMPVALRYVPSSPWYEPVGEAIVRVPIRGPGILAKAPILVAGLAVLVFFLASRISSKNAKPEARTPSTEALPDGKPRLEVVRAAARGAHGWTGRVVDAHERGPVANARVWVERGTFEGRSILASVAADAEGHFEIPALPGLVGDETIAAEAPLHAHFAQALPVPGEIAIALAQRKRALLARMVKWAKRRGAPFDVRPEPTPGHVRRAAGDEPDTARWAEAVERAAFGGGEVDARLEREIEKMAPGGGESREGHPEDRE